MKLLIMELFFQPPATLFLLGPNILLTVQFLNALSWSRECCKCVCACHKGLWREQKYSFSNPYSCH